MTRMRRALACCALALAAACSAPNADPERLLAEAVRHQTSGAHAAAIIQLRNLLAIAPAHVEARRMLAMSYLETGEAAAAEDELRKALEHGLERRAALVALGRAQLFQGKHERLLEELKPPPDVAPELALEIDVLRGLASLALGRNEDAKRLLESALERNPGHGDALLGLAGVAAAEGRREQARELIDRAAQADPGNVDVWLVRGDYHRSVDQPAQALEDYKRAAALKPDNLNANLQLAALYVDQERFEEARKHVDAIRPKLADNAYLNYLLGLIEFRKKNYAGAREALDRSLRKNPNHLPALLLAGNIEYAAGNYDKAVEALRAVHERSPANPLARRMLAAAMLRAGQVQRAVELLERGLNEAPNDSGLLAVLAEAYVQNGDIARALPLLERAARSDPKNVQAYGQLQLARLLGGQGGAVLAELEAAARTRQTDEGSELLLALGLLQRRQFDRALGAIEALERRQTTPLTYNLRAAALLGKGDPEAARKALENALALNPRFVTALINLAALDLDQQGAHAARRRLENYLQGEPHNVPVLLTLARMAPQLGAPRDLVFEWLERARAADPRSIRPLLMLAGEHLRAGDARKALQYAEQAQKINPDQNEVLETLGAIQVALGETPAALGTFAKLVLQNPQSPAAHFQLARVQAASNNAAAAGLSLRRALELAPRFAPAMSLLGELELKAGRFEAVAQLAQELRRAHPQSPAGFVLEGDLQLARQNPAQAVAMYDEAYARGDRSANLAIRRHIAMRQAGRAAEADAHLARFLKEQPGEAAIHAYLGDQHLFAGRHAEAIKHYNEVLRQQPLNALVLNNLAWASYHSGDRRAREYAEKAHSLRPQDALILDTLGWITVEAGQTERGIELLQRAVAIAPEHPEARYHLAQALLKAGQHGRARRELEQLLSGKQKFDREAEARELLTRLR